jgi:cell division protein ZipA
LSILSSAWLWLLIALALIGGAVFWFWRKRQNMGWHNVPTSDPYFRKQQEYQEPAFDDTPLDEVIEDEFWMPDEEPDVLSDNHATSAPEPGAESPDKDVPRELIVALFVRALRGEMFHGADVFSALENLGLSFGAMDIYHHYGLDEPLSNPSNAKAVFSVANMKEPGTLIPQQADDFQSPGLIFFMRLPGPLGGRVAFEYMLNHAQRMAELLKGNLEDEHRQTLNPESIAHLREGIENFEAARR